MGSRTHRAFAALFAAAVLLSLVALATSTLLPLGSLTEPSGHAGHPRAVGVSAVAPLAGEFWVWATPTNLTFAPGQTGTSYVGFATGGGFNGTVTLTTASNPSGVTTTCSPSSITPKDVSTCTLRSSTAGSYSVIFTGTNGSLVRTASISVSVGTPPAPDFSLWASPGSVSFVAGQGATSMIGLTATGGFSGSVALTGGSSPSGVTTSCSPSTISGFQTSTCTMTGSTAGSYMVTITGTSGSLVRTTTIWITVTSPPAPDFMLWANPTTASFASGQSATSTIGLTATGGFTGTVALAGGSSPSGITSSCSPSGISGSQTSTCTMTSSTAGSYTVTITGTSGSLHHDATIAATVSAPADFSVGASPNRVSFVANASVTSTISLASTGGFSGTVALSASSSPAGVTTTCSPTSITGTQTSTCTLTSSAAGTYTVTLKGTSGTLTHTATIDVTVNPPPDFSLAADPTSVWLTSGQPATSTMRLQITGGFSGTVDLSYTSVPAGATMNCVPWSLAGTQTSTCSLNGPTAGSYTVTITGRSGSLSRVTKISVTISSPPPQPDFALHADPDHVSLSAGTSASTIISVISSGGFSGAIDLSVTSASEVTASCTPSSIGDRGTASCTVGGSTPGSFQVSIRGTSGTTERTIPIVVTVTPGAPNTDTTPPEVLFTSPTDGGTLPPGPTTVSGKASDKAGVQKVELSTDNVTWVRANGTTSWSGTLILVSGTNTVYVRATDAVGNVKTIRITVLGAPGFSPTSPPWSQSPLALASAAQIGLIALVPLVAIAVGVPLVVRARRKKGRANGAGGEPAAPGTTPTRASALGPRLRRFLRRPKKP